MSIIFAQKQDIFLDEKLMFLVISGAFLQAGRFVHEHAQLRLV